MNKPPPTSRRSPTKPAYDLPDFKSGRLVIAKSALLGAAAMGMAKADIKQALGALRPAHFFKCMASEQRPGTMMDVYHLPHSRTTVYVKFSREPNGVYVLTSFKEK